MKDNQDKLPVVRMEQCRKGNAWRVVSFFYDYAATRDIQRKSEPVSAIVRTCIAELSPKKLSRQELNRRAALIYDTQIKERENMSVSPAHPKGLEAAANKYLDRANKLPEPERLARYAWTMFHGTVERGMVPILIRRRLGALVENGNMDAPANYQRELNRLRANPPKDFFARWEWLLFAEFTKLKNQLKTKVNIHGYIEKKLGQDNVPSISKFSRRLHGWGI